MYLDIKTKKTVTQILIPMESKDLQLEIMRMNHDQLMSGHLGFARTLARIQLYYYWPSIRKDVKEYIKTCDACQKCKKNKPDENSNPLRPSIPEGPNFRLGIDLVIVDETAAGYKVVLVIIDYFTKFAIAVPLKSKTEKEVAEAIYNNWYTLFGIPYEIQTDQGSEFTNDLLKRLNGRLNVGHQVTTPYNPSPNGLVERFNRTMKDCLLTYCSTHVATWDQFLTGVIWAYNSSLNPVTGFSPHYLMMGREPRQPVDILEGSYNEIKHDYAQYSTNLTMHLKQAHVIVK